MKNLWLFMVLAAALGTATAWSVNYNNYGHRDGYFGPFTMEGDITPENVMNRVYKDSSEGFARVELPASPNHDFGMMAPGTTGEHTFVIKNTGSESLRLRLGATTCKCTLGELDQEALAPGESTEIKLTWTVKEGETDFAQTAQVITNDPAKVVIQFEITGKVINEVDVIPETWTFGEVPTGEPLEVNGVIYSFLENDIAPTTTEFSSEEMTALAEFKVESFKPTPESDGIRSAARQAFRISAKVKPGMRQGAVSQNLVFGFNKLDENGEILPPEEGSEGRNEYFVVAPVKGRIIGPLGFILSGKLTESSGGAFIYDFGRISSEGSLKAKTFVVLKGSERDNTKLSVGEISPGDVIKATLGEPLGRGSMKLYPLEIELKPGKDLIERLGKDKDDYGWIWIESDNPKVARLRLRLTFALEGR